MRSLVLAVALLAGCETPGELIQGGPRSTYQLKLPQDRAAVCLARAAENHIGTLSAIVRPLDQNTTEVVVRVQGQDAVLVAHVKPTGSQSQATFYRSNFYRWSADVIAAMVAGC